MAEDIPPPIKKFVQERLDSVEQLNVLLLLRLSPDRVWSTEQISHELRSTDQSIQKRLEGLYSRNVLVRVPELQGGHRFSPASDECRQLIEELAVINHTKPYRIMELIYSRKSDALQDFADAFKLGGDKK